MSGLGLGEGGRKGERFKLANPTEPWEEDISGSHSVFLVRLGRLGVERLGTQGA